MTNELQTIIDTIDPVQTVNAALDDMLTALTVGLAFIPEFEAAGAVCILTKQVPPILDHFLNCET